MANPVNRKEAIIAGENIDPVTREEYYLKQLADGSGSGGGGGEPVTLIPEQSFTATEAEGNFYAGNLNGESLGDDVVGFADVTVTYDGVDYYFAETELEFGADVRWGLPGQTPSADFSVYPFSIGFSPEGTGIIVGDTNEHTVKVTGTQIASMYIDANGIYDVSNYGKAEVDVPGIEPSGTIDITSNSSSVDVYNYALANVNVVPTFGKVNVTVNGVNGSSAMMYNCVYVSGNNLRIKTENVGSTTKEIGILTGLGTGLVYYLLAKVWTTNYYIANVTGQSGTVSDTTINSELYKVIGVKNGDNITITTATNN